MGEQDDTDAGLQLTGGVDQSLVFESFSLHMLLGIEVSSSENMRQQK